MNAPDLYGEKFARNPITKAQQARVQKSVFAIIGLGGTGGFILENLLRMGAEKLVVFDHDRFELSNFNRQSLATEEFLDMPKVHAAIARAKTINNGIDIRTHEEFGEESGPAIKGADIVLDGTDNVKSKLILSRMARSMEIPYVFCSAQDSRGIVSVFTSYRFEKAFHLPKEEEALERYQMCQSIICPAASLAGTLAASQAVNVLLKKPFAKAPQAIFFDLFKKDVFWKGRLG
jgi:molybdopterin/thiamine biosynthesis adenylyltransferase